MKNIGWLGPEMRRASEAELFRAMPRILPGRVTGGRQRTSSIGIRRTRSGARSPNRSSSCTRPSVGSVRISSAISVGWGKPAARPSTLRSITSSPSRTPIRSWSATRMLARYIASPA